MIGLLYGASGCQKWGSIISFMAFEKLSNQPKRVNTRATRNAYVLHLVICLPFTTTRATGPSSHISHIVFAIRSLGDYNQLLYYHTPMADLEGVSASI
jgi:hypothetical protein